MEELLEVLEDFDEDQIEDALLDMLGLPFVFHIDSYIKLYLRWKDKINFEKINDALIAFAYSTSHLTLPEKLKIIEEEPMLEALKLKTLGEYLMLACMIIQGAISTALQEVNFSSGILLRTALETGLKGMLFQHLLDWRFRARVKRKSHISNYYTDSVVRFLKDVENRSRSSGKCLEDIIADPEVFLIDYLKIKDVARWLEEWNVFEPIVDASQLIVKKYENLSLEVHGKTLALYLRQAISVATLGKAMAEVIEIIDLMLVGMLNTVRNLTPEELTKLDSEPWRNFTTYVKNGGLEYTWKVLATLQNHRNMRL